MSRLPWHLNFSHIIIPWPKLCGMFPTYMKLVWWLCSDASWGNYYLYIFYWSFWIITIETQQVILFYTVNMSRILHKLLGLLACCIHDFNRLLRFLLVFRLRLSSSNRVSQRADKISILVSLSKLLIWFVCSASTYNYNPSWLLPLCWQQLLMTVCLVFCV